MPHCFAALLQVVGGVRHPACSTSPAKLQKSVRLLDTRYSSLHRSWAEYSAELVAASRLSRPVPAHLPRMAQLLGFFPRSYAESGSPAADSSSPVAGSGFSAAQRRSALAALLQRRGVAGPGGAAFMPCAVTPLGATAAADSTAAARVLHVLQGGLDTGLWSDLPEGHAQRPGASLSAGAASVRSLTVRPKLHCKFLTTCAVSVLWQLCFAAGLLQMPDAHSSVLKFADCCYFLLSDRRAWRRFWGTCGFRTTRSRRWRGRSTACCSGWWRTCPPAGWRCTCARASP